MSITIRVNTTERPSTLVARAAGIKKYGVDFKGDTTSGSFSGKGVKGTYSIQDRGVTVTITDKPVYIPWHVVESQVRAFFDIPSPTRASSSRQKSSPMGKAPSRANRARLSPQRRPQRRPRRPVARKRPEREDKLRSGPTRDRVGKKRDDS